MPPLPPSADPWLSRLLPGLTRMPRSRSERVPPVRDAVLLRLTYEMEHLAKKHERSANFEPQWMHRVGATLEASAFRCLKSGGLWPAPPWSPACSSHH